MTTPAPCADTEFFELDADGRLTLKAFPAAAVRRDTSQSLPDATTTVISWETEVFDNDGMVDLVGQPTRITFTRAGLYVVNLHARTTGLRSDYRRVFGQLRLNGATIIAQGPNNQSASTLTAREHMSVGTIFDFAAGDFVEALAFQDNTANLATNIEGADPEGASLTVARITVL